MSGVGLMGVRVIVSAPWEFDTVQRQVLPPEYPEQSARRRAWNRLTKWRIEQQQVEAKNHPAIKLPDGSIVMTARMQARLRAALEATEPKGGE